jgi:hypothetical protein
MADTPVWLWSADASRILWGNAAAAAIFNAASSVALTGHTIDPKGSAALQIARLAGTLPLAAAPRLERLRGFGGRLGGAVMCGCSRISLADRTPAILIVATESAGQRLTPADKAERLLAGGGEPLALFAADGALLSATASGRARLGRAQNLAGLQAVAVGATALAAGRAEGEHAGNKFSISRIGADASSALLLAFTEEAKPAPAERAAAPKAPAAPVEKPVKPPAPVIATAAAQKPAGQNAKSGAAASRSRRCSRAASTAPLCLADGRWRPLHHRLRRIQVGDGAADRSLHRRAVERHRNSTRARSRRPGRPRHRLARDLERHHHRLPGGRRRHAPSG